MNGDLDWGEKSTSSHAELGKYARTRNTNILINQSKINHGYLCRILWISMEVV